jgi:hypothetical protein
VTGAEPRRCLQRIADAQPLTSAFRNGRIGNRAAVVGALLLGHKAATHRSSRPADDCSRRIQQPAVIDRRGRIDAPGVAGADDRFRHRDGFRTATALATRGMTRACDDGRALATKAIVSSPAWGATRLSRGS